MLAFESALARHLASTHAVASLAVGGIGPVVVTQDVDAAPVYPNIRYTKISGTEEYSHSGPTGLQQARYQFDVYALHPVAARQLADALRLALGGFVGTMEGAEGIVEIGAIFFEDEDASYVDELEVHWVRMDFMIWFSE